MIYVHLKHLKFYVDLVMRFGNNEKYLMCLVEPYNGKEKKVQTNFPLNLNEKYSLPFFIFYVRPSDIVVFSRLRNVKELI